MKKTKNILSCAFLSALGGIFTGLLIFVFKIAASYVIRASISIYEFLRENIIFVPVFLIGIVLISFAIHYILKAQPDCQGGGIPTAIAYIRGNLSFNWMKTILILPLSALLTFFSGIPLGNEGPSVQLGCAAGRGVTSILKDEPPQHRKYIMTATASAGFAAATGAPFSAVIFAFEEIYRSFSVMLLMSSAIAIMCATLVNNLLGAFFQISTRLFAFSLNSVMPLKFVWAAVVVGTVTGLAVFIISLSDKYTQKILIKLNNISMMPKILVVSLIAAFFGLCSKMYIGTGHDLIEEIFENGNIGILLLITVLIVRALLLILAGGIGITGGKFLPTLALGALLGELSARFLIHIGFIDGEYRNLLVLMGIAAFLGAKSYIPIVSLCFSVEALCGFSNIVHFIVCIGVSFLFVKIFKTKDFSETVIEKESKVEKDATQSEEVKI